MNMRDLIQPNEIAFQWTETKTGYKTETHGVWAEVHRYRDGTAHFNIQNRCSSASAPQRDVASAKLEAEELMRGMIKAEVEQAIKTLELFCTVKRQPVSC